MRINDVELKNIGPHRKLSVVFESGLIGLLGQNGAGKSTLVNSVYAALTNDFSRFSVPKPEIINNSSGKEDSYIKLSGTHRGQNFQLIRWLRPNKSELSFQGNNYYKATEINQIIEDQLGISKLIIDKYVFVNQWDMFQFIDQTDSERAKIFQYLCGTEQSAKIHAVCSNFVARYQNSEVFDNSEELESAVKAAHESMTRNKKKCLSLKETMIEAEEVAKIQEKLDNYSEAKNAEKRLHANQEKLEKAKDSCASYSKQKIKIKKLVAKMESELNDFKSTDKYKAAVSYIDNCEKTKKVQAEVSELTTRVSSLKEDLADLKKPSKPENYIDDSDRQTSIIQLAQFKAEIASNEDVLEDFKLDEEAFCPHCKQAVPADYVKNIAAKQNDLKLQAESLTNTLEASLRFDRALKRYSELASSISSNIEKANFRLSLLENSKDTAAGIDEEEANALIEEAKLKQDDLGYYQSKLTDIKKFLSESEGISSTLQNSIDSDLLLINAAISGADANQYRIELEQHFSAEKEYNIALGTYRESKRNWKKHKELLASLNKKLEERAKIQNLLETISSAGDVFHWNNLPKTVAQANMELLVDDINENLAMFNNPFHVEAGTDLTFKVFFPGKPAVKAKQLSGGQKVVLAISFRAAIDQVFGHNVGMMFLDEPTAGLDDDNVSYFHTALQQLAKKVTGDRQLVVITHVKELSNVFDQLVTV